MFIGKIFDNLETKSNLLNCMFNLHLFKNLVFAYMFAISVSLLAQEEYNLDDEDYCEHAKQKAREHFNNDNIVLTTYGLLVRTDWDFHEFYKTYMYNTYNILLKDGGCVIIAGDLCFENEMKRLINNKFGENFLKEAKEKARAIYEDEK